MRALFRPTLVRRVVGALLIAFMLVWVVLLAVIFMAASNPVLQDKGVQDIGQGLFMSLSPLEQPGEARAVAAATSEQINHIYQSNGIPALMLVQLLDQQGRQVYLSPQAGETALAVTSSAMSDATINGRQFRTFTGTAKRWTFTLAAAKADDIYLLSSIVSDLSLYLLVAFPFILVPIWIAVARGLRPLRQLSEQIGARGADDLSSTGMDARYAELKPLVGAIDGFLTQLRGKIAREHGFVHDAAHELRTPMAVISAQAHVLAMAADEVGRREAEHYLEQAIARASQLIEQLLQLARMDGAAALQVHAIDVAQLVRQELAHVEQKATENQLELSLDAPEYMPLVIDVHAFQSILHNLVDNAMGYANPGGRIAVEMRLTDGCLILSVADDGPGIAAPEQDKVFERFYRGKGHDRAGSGLGLAIVRQAALRLNGTVRLLPGLDGRGCAFVVAASGY